MAIFIMGNDILYEFLKFFGIFFAMPNGPVNVNSNWISFVHQLLALCNTLGFLTATGNIFDGFLYSFHCMPQIILVYGFFFDFNQFVDAKVSIMRVTSLEAKFS